MVKVVEETSVSKGESLRTFDLVITSHNGNLPVQVDAYFLHCIFTGKYCGAGALHLGKLFRIFIIE